MIHNTELAKNTPTDDYVGAQKGVDFIDEDNVISYMNDEGPSFVFMRGCGEDYSVQAHIFARKLRALGTLHFPYQTEGEHNQDVIDEGIIAAVGRDNGREHVFVATSMGEMNTLRSFVDYDVRKALGNERILGVISLSGMTSRVDLQPSMQWASGVSGRLLPYIGPVWQSYRRHKASGELYHGPNSTASEVRRQYMSSASMSPDLVGSQHREIHNSKPMQKGALAGFAIENPRMELVQITAPYDGVVNWQSSRSSTEVIFEREVKIEIDRSRHKGSHADDIGYIGPLARRMASFRGVAHHLVDGVVVLGHEYASAS